MTLLTLKRDDAPPLAYHLGEGDETLPTLLFCGGFRSDMEGTKALFLEARCRERNQRFIRFDYRGHGQSGGRFEDGTIGLWRQDALDVIDALCQNAPLVVAGSSMGGWLALLCALARPQVRALVGLAAAPDFTREIKSLMNADQEKQLLREGFFDVPTDYAPEPYKITSALLEDGEKWCILDGPIPLSIPVTLIQGKKDTDVPWRTAETIKYCLSGPDVNIVWREEGDHRLSTPEDLDILDQAVIAACRKIS
jgi:pimeloyl-ACP methyl ester carboxylesterase